MGPDEGKSVWRAYGERSTFHGVWYVLLPYHVARRVIWGILVLLCILLFWYTIAISLMHYYEYPKESKTAWVDVEEQEFPAATICNNNALRLSKLVTDGNYTELNKFYSGGSLTPAEETKIKGLDVKQLLTDAGPKVEDLIQGCSFSGTPCGAQDFTETFTDAGKCFTFNKDMKKRVSESGRMSGLKLTLNAEIYEEGPGNNLANGISVALHNSKQIPVPSISSGNWGIFSVAPGQQANVRILQEKYESLPAPYGWCHGDEAYSTCMQKCYASTMNEECSCVPYKLMDFVTGATQCDLIAAKSCKASLMAKQGMCACPGSCTEDVYNADVSSSPLSERKLGSMAGGDKQKIQDAYNAAKTAATTAGVSDFPATMKLSDNIIMLDLFFSELGYEEMVQVTAYTVMDLMKDIGLHLLLFLGASVLSLVELLDLSIAACCSKAKNKAYINKA